MKNKEASVSAIPIPNGDVEYEHNRKKSAAAKKKMAKNRTMILLDRMVADRLCCCKKRIGNTYNSVISNLLDKYENKINKDGQ